MSYYEKQYKRRLSLGQSNNTLITLIAINLVIFVLFSFVKLVYYVNHGNAQGLVLYNENVLPWVTLSADTHTIISRPWTILTHIFMHASVWHVFANMIWLWAFGYIMQDMTGSRKIVPVFIYGALGGALAFVLAYNFLPALKTEVHVASALGASAGVMGVAVATTMVAPGYRIFPMLNGGIPLWALTALYVIIDLATIPISNPGGHIAHLAGAFTGFLFIFFLRRGYDWGEWMNNFFDWVNNLFNPDKPRKGKHIKEELFYKSTSSPYTKTSNITQQRIDEILDKINQKGYSFLTDEEKELLKKASKEDL
ncbi:MAG: rhomboid family intramembrane serine protease [Chitinophagales bacterium]